MKSLVKRESCIGFGPDIKRTRGFWISVLPEKMKWANYRRSNEAYRLANAIRRTQKADATEQILGKARPSFPHDAGMLYHLARMTAAQGRLREARRLLKDAFRRDSSLRELAVDDEDLELVWNETEAPD